MRRLIAFLGLVLGLVLVPTAASAAPAARLASAAPVYNNYLQCFNGWVYTDFTDPDGDDTRLNVMMAVQRNGQWLSYWMHNTGASAHGVFFYMQLSEIGVDPKTVQRYAFTAADETNTWAADWTYADSSCHV